MGRPKSKIDWKKVDNLLVCHCTGTEVASVLGVCADTLYRAVEDKFNMAFALYSQQKKECGKAIIKADQFKASHEGNTTMQIWLGKQHLGQKDKQELDVGLKGSIPVKDWITSKSKA